jgi:nucleoside-diphosphate-sugar epimerase
MVYERSTNHPSKEEDAFDSIVPSTDYGLSKLVGEKLCHAFATQYGIPYVIWRPFNIITPHEKNGDELGISHVFADFMHNLVTEKKNPLPIIGDGEQIRCFTWIEDVANLIGKYSFDSKTDNETYNVGNPEPITMKDLARLIYQEDDELKFETVKNYSDDVLIRIPDVTKAKEELGFNPSLRVKESIDKCLNHYLEVQRQNGIHDTLTEKVGKI